MTKTGPCPHCGGESDGSCYYSIPAQTRCKDCGKMWSYGGGIKILSGKEGMKKRPGMYFRFCIESTYLHHLRLPNIGIGHSIVDTPTLCGLKALNDIFSSVTYESIMGDPKTCSACRAKFVEMTE